MERLYRSKFRRCVGDRAAGQSLPLIAMMILILVAIVGLAVDVGNTYAEERRVVAAGNAAAIAGMNAYILNSAGGTISARNADVYRALVNSLESNGVNLGTEAGKIQFKATYLGSDGKELQSPREVANDNTPVKGAAYIQINMDGTVNTFFARVVGRDTLPVKTDAFASFCPPGATGGVYPIAVDTQEIAGDRFRAPAGFVAGQNNPEYYTINDPDYGALWVRRLYTKHLADRPGQFGWLRWMERTGAGGAAANSAPELARSLTGDGNISAGFQEAPWEDVSGATRPDVYPDNPGTLGRNDWVYGNPGVSNSNAVRAALDFHVTNRTQMMLPMYRAAVFQGNNAQFLVDRLGVFRLVGYNLGGNNTYFDLAYLGAPAAQTKACAVSAVLPSDNLAVGGAVSFYGEYEERPTSQLPIQYVVVLDVSGSMNANFAGQGRAGAQAGGAIRQCANGPAGAPRSENCGNPSNAWMPVEERRIYVAKQALISLVNRMNAGANRVHTNRPSDEFYLVWFNDGTPAGNNSGWLTDPAQMRSRILTAGASSGGNFTTSGGTNGASGLFRAAQALESRATDAPLPTNQNVRVPFKRVVIFVTDGVSNVFFDPSASNLARGSSNAASFPERHWCRDLGEAAIETAECQTNAGAATATYDGRATIKVNNRNVLFDRPITSMVNVSTNNIQRNPRVNAEVFTLALSNIPATGLANGVPSNSTYFFRADQLVRTGNTTNVDNILAQIDNRVRMGQCQARTEGWRNSVLPEQAASGAGVPPYPVVGEVTLTNNQSQAVLRTPIRAGTNGVLSYEFGAVPTGEYTLRAKLFYKSPNDPSSVAFREYNRFSIRDGADTVETLPLTVQASGRLDTRINQPIELKLPAGACASR